MSNRPNAESETGRDGGGRRSEDRAGEVSGEAVARPAVCTAEVMERPRIMARTSVTAARMLANEERNRQLSRSGAAPWRRALPRRNGLPGAGSSARVRNGVRRIFRVPKKKVKPNASALTAPASKRHKGSGLESISGMEEASSERGQDHTVDLNDCVNDAPFRPR